jgi:hypothetical protein
MILTKVRMCLNHNLLDSVVIGALVARACPMIKAQLIKAQ